MGLLKPQFALPLQDEVCFKAMMQTREAGISWATTVSRIKSNVSEQWAKLLVFKRFLKMFVISYLMTQYFDVNTVKLSEEFEVGAGTRDLAGLYWAHTSFFSFFLPTLSIS